MFNNDITYNEKWNTPDNLKAFKTLEKKYFAKSVCGPSCPVSWAPEVLKMMDTLQQELGFCYNESSIQGHNIQGNALRWFILNPLRGLTDAIKYNVFKKPSKLDRKTATRVYKTWTQRAVAVISGFTDPIMYGVRALTIYYVNPLRNRLESPKIRLAQIKEKYGYLTCYFDADNKYKERISSEISKCAAKLTEKGCYHPIKKSK